MQVIVVPFNSISPLVNLISAGTPGPFIKISSPRRAKVRSADDFYIPPRSEVIVEVFVDKFDDDNSEGPHNYLLEPFPFFEQGLRQSTLFPLLIVLD
jgi:hypothetical protein